MSDKTIVLKDKDGKEVSVKMPETPQPKVIIEYSSKHNKAEKPENTKPNND